MTRSDMRILVADDDADILEGTAHLLEKAGYIVDRASDGEKALRIAIESPPDLFLIDREMPGADGLEACRRIKADPALAEAFVVIISGIYTESSSQAEGLELGADGYIARPIENRELLARVESYVRILGLNRLLKAAVQEKQTLLDEKAMVLREVHHRVKNNLNTINSFLQLQADVTEDISAKKVLLDAGSRVQSMFMLYKQLFQSVGFTSLSIKTYLPPLINQVIQNFPNCSLVRLEMNIEDFILDAKQLQPLGMIVNEVLTNIMKYAFIGKAGGSILISAVSRNDKVTVSIQDSGNGIPESIDFDRPSGFGLTLIKGLSRQLGGSVRIERGPGTKIMLEFAAH
ncbi:MAG: response regulator [Spirochaetota bacterium]